MGDEAAGETGSLRRGSLLLIAEVVPGSEPWPIARYLADTTALACSPAAIALVWLPVSREVTDRLRKRLGDGDRLAAAACDVLFFTARLVWLPSNEMPVDKVLAAATLRQVWRRHARGSNGFIDTGLMPLQSEIWRQLFTDSEQVVMTSNAPEPFRTALVEKPS